MDHSLEENKDLVKVNVLFFAQSRELVGQNKSEVIIASRSFTTAQLTSFLLKTFPRLEPLKGSMIIALNEDYLSVDENICLSNGDEIAIIPPLSGG